MGSVRLEDVAARYVRGERHPSCEAHRETSDRNSAALPGGRDGRQARCGVRRLCREHSRNHVNGETWTHIPDNASAKAETAETEAERTREG